MISYLEFEKPVAQIQERIAELRNVDANKDVDVKSEIERLEAKSFNRSKSIPCFWISSRTI